MSTLKVDTLVAADGSSPVTLTKQFAPKSFSKIDGSGTVSIQESENVSSLTDNGTGDYTVTYTNAMSAATHGEFGCSDNGGTNQRRFANMNSTRAAGSSRMASHNNAGSYADADNFCTLAMGDLA